MHDWPKLAHPPEGDPLSGGGVPLSVPVGGGLGGAPQVPAKAPGGTLQASPAQQSALDVHVPVVLMHEDGAQVRAPVASGTQGFPLQQSLAVEQL